jgi:hypothetical protein
MAKMDKEELLELLRSKEQAAAHYVHGVLGSEREKAMQAYHRLPYGNEQEGWSSVITSDVQDTVEWLLPSLLKTFTSTDKAVSFEPSTAADVKPAEQATDACNYVFYKQNNGFLTLYTAIKDALTLGNCAVMWRKETSEVVSSMPFKGATPEMLAMLLQEGDEITEQEEAPIIDPQTGQPAIDMMGQPIMGFNGRFKRVEEKTIIKVEAFNPADLLVDREWTSPLLGECPYVARLYEVTLSDLKQMGFKDVTAEELRASSVSNESERVISITSRDGYSLNDTDDTSDQSADDSLAKGWLRIEYVLADIDGDGIAELNCIYRLENEILKSEIVSHVPFATFSPVLNTHRWDGLSIVDLVGDLQKLHTELLRQKLNSIYLTVNPRHTVLTDSQGSPYANMDDFLNMRPGAAVRQTRPDSIQQLITPPAGGDVMPMLDYISGMREERTGVSRTSQGLNPDSLNNTATGRALDQSAAQQRIELIARIIAEVLLKPTFLGVLKLLTDGDMKKLSFRLRDEFVEYDPNEWRDQYDMTVNVGLGSGDANQKLQALQMIAQNQIALMPMGLATPDNIYHVQSKIVEAAGFKDVQNFIKDPQGQPPPPPPQDPALQIEQMKQQGAAQTNQFKAQQEMQTLQMTTQLQDAQHQREMQRDMEVERNKQEMQARDNQFQAQLDAQKESQRMQMEEASKEADRMLQKYIAELNAKVKLEIAGIKSPETLEGEEVEKVEKEDKFLQAMQMMLERMNQPKMVVRDNMGKAIGIQSVGAQ